MRGLLVAAAVLAFAGSSDARDVPVRGTTSFAGLNFPSTARAATPVAAPLQPVVGSVRRTGHFVHPHTGRTKYTGTAYNSALGQFGAYSFRR